MKNYFYAIYDLSDKIIGIFDSQNEIANYLEKTNSKTTITQISVAINRKSKIRYKNQWYRIYKYEV